MSFLLNVQTRFNWKKLIRTSYEARVCLVFIIDFRHTVHSIAHCILLYNLCNRMYNTCIVYIPILEILYFYGSILQCSALMSSDKWCQCLKQSKFHIVSIKIGQWLFTFYHHIHLNVGYQCGSVIIYYYYIDLFCWMF